MDFRKDWISRIRFNYDKCFQEHIHLYLCHPSPWIPSSISHNPSGTSLKVARKKKKEGKKALTVEECYRVFSISFETRQTGDESILKTAFRWWWEWWWWWRWRVLINFFPSPSVWLTQPFSFTLPFEKMSLLYLRGATQSWKFIPHYNFVCMCVRVRLRNHKFEITRHKKKK